MIWRLVVLNRSTKYLFNGIPMIIIATAVGMISPKIMIVVISNGRNYPVMLIQIQLSTAVEEPPRIAFITKALSPPDVVGGLRNIKY